MLSHKPLCKAVLLILISVMSCNKTRSKSKAGKMTQAVLSSAIMSGPLDEAYTKDKRDIFPYAKSTRDQGVSNLVQVHAKDNLELSPEGRKLPEQDSSNSSVSHYSSQGLSVSPPRSHASMSLEDFTVSLNDQNEKPSFVVVDKGDGEKSLADMEQHEGSHIVKRRSECEQKLEQLGIKLQSPDTLTFTADTSEKLFRNMDGQDGVSGKCSHVENLIFANDSPLNAIPDQFWKPGTCNLKRIVVGTSIKEIGYRAFSGCEVLMEVIFSRPSKLKSIGNEAFAESFLPLHSPFRLSTKGLEAIEFPPSLQDIGDHAFSSKDWNHSVLEDKAVGCRLQTVSFAPDGQLRKNRTVSI